MNNAENSSDFAFLGKMGRANREVDGTPGVVAVVHINGHNSKSNYFCSCPNRTQDQLGEARRMSLLPAPSSKYPGGTGGHFAFLGKVGWANREVDVSRTVRKCGFVAIQAPPDFSILGAYGRLQPRKVTVCT